MINWAVPFLTDIDPQAAVKGSRDPLGVQPIWSRLGRHVVGNVTTVSTSVRDFSTTILGYHFTERVREANGGEPDLAVFLKWEQMAGHARYRADHNVSLRGIERVAKANAEGGRIRIAADASGQILSNQRTYGLWGLYSGPARAAGLLEGEPTRVSPVGRRLIESVYMPAFASGGLKNADAVVAKLLKPRVDLDADGADKTFVKTIGRVLSPTLNAVELDAFREHLLLGRAPDKTEGRQAALAAAMVADLERGRSDAEWTLSAPEVRHLAKRCRQQAGAGAAAADRLERICVAESLLAPAAALFGVLLGSDGQTKADVATHVRKVWGDGLVGLDPEALEALESELRSATGDSSHDAAAGVRWVQMGRALASGDYTRALDLLMEQNAFVMKARAGAGPWVDEAAGLLRVRYRDENLGDLPSRKELPTFWRHSYFIDALHKVAVELHN